ncbi:MAG: hypothetical protein LQ350_008395 [Teloschistes chrysophthalmus]|nr:MAG: hypothetical protein LQ350_008395 [Niorma chrysophthalma]
MGASQSFVSDAEFSAATEDYVIVGQQESTIRPLTYNDDDSILDDDEEKESREEYNMTVKTEFALPSFGDMFGLGRHQQLLYADVDCSDPEHKNIRKRVAAEGYLKEESKKSKEAREKLIEHMARITKPYGLTVEEADEWKAKERVRSAELLEHAPGVIPTQRRIIDYLLQLQDEERRETLNILSGQHLRKIQRPVILLLGIINKHSTESFGTPEGWIVAYNFYEDRLIIKPFFSDETHRLLTEKWDTDLPNDGISFSGRPSGLIERYWKVYSDILEREHEKDPNAFRYRVLVIWFTIKFVMGHWMYLSSRKYEESGGYALDTPSRYASILPGGKQFIIRSMANLKLDRKTRFKHAPQGLLEMHDSIIHQLSMIRQDVVKFKKAGREVATQKEAEMYGRLLERLRSFSLEPEKEI